MILLVSNDHAGKLVIAQSRLNHTKKRSHGFPTPDPNQSANDGILTIFTHVIVVPAFGTNACDIFENVHLLLLVDNVIVYVPAAAYVCIVLHVRF